MDLLLVQTMPAVGSILRAYLGSGGAARDVVQDVLFEVYRSLPKLRVPEKFQAWVARICQRRALDWLRRRYREEELFSFEAEFRFDDLPDTQSRDAFLDLLYRDLLDSFGAALERLPERYRRVLVLRFRECLDVEEIARATGQKPGTVKSLLSRGVVKLRNEMEKGA